MNILYVIFLSGIKIGEIGTKLGMKTVNNGYLALENVRIPREQMLMKNSKVLKVRNTYLSGIMRHIYF
jgi:alkylation response protein AidB-like acyl-CoA dehydrogenase